MKECDICGSRATNKLEELYLCRLCYAANYVGLDCPECNREMIEEEYPKGSYRMVCKCGYGSEVYRETEIIT